MIHRGRIASSRGTPTRPSQLGLLAWTGFDPDVVRPMHGQTKLIWAKCSSQPQASVGWFDSAWSSSVRAWGGCLGVIWQAGVAGCDMLGEAANHALIPRSPLEPRELKHLSTWRKRNQPRLP